jgi:phosphomevalonate kinase
VKLGGSADRSSKERDFHLNLIHHVAQLCHCLAQKKIGSGFDVASAVYGSQVYRRFSNDILTKITENTTNDQRPVEITPDILASLCSLDWDHEICPIRLPVGTQLILGDVHSGTKSSHMASAVLEWKQRCPIEGKKIYFLFHMGGGEN